MVSPTDDALRLAHVVIVVQDIATRAQVWAAFLGLPMADIIASTTVPVKLVFFQVGDVGIELIEPTGEPSTWQHYLDQHGEGIHSVAFHTSRLEERLVDLAVQGALPVQQGTFPGGIYAYVDTTSSLGSIVELIA